LPEQVVIDGKLIYQWLDSDNYCKTAPLGTAPPHVGGTYFDPITNYYSGTTMEFDLALRKWQFYLYRCPADETLY
jgi:hypothetical protein